MRLLVSCFTTLPIKYFNQSKPLVSKESAARSNKVNTSFDFFLQLNKYAS